MRLLMGFLLLGLILAVGCGHIAFASLTVEEVETIEDLRNRAQALVEDSTVILNHPALLPEHVGDAQAMVSLASEVKQLMIDILNEG